MALGIALYKFGFIEILFVPTVPASPIIYFFYPGIHVQIINLTSCRLNLYVYLYVYLYQYLTIGMERQYSISIKGMSSARSEPV